MQNRLDHNRRKTQRDLSNNSLQMMWNLLGTEKDNKAKFKILFQLLQSKKRSAGFVTVKLMASGSNRMKIQIDEWVFMFENMPFTRYVSVHPNCKMMFCQI